MDSRERDIRTGKLDERRAEERHKALKGARIIFNSGYGAMECLVRNQSKHGARLVFGDVAAVPNHFAIFVSGTQQRQNASVQWRYGDQVGIKVA